MFTIKTTKTNERSGGEKENNREFLLQKREAQMNETIYSIFAKKATGNYE